MFAAHPSLGFLEGIQRPQGGVARSSGMTVSSSIMNLRWSSLCRRYRWETRERICTYANILAPKRLTFRTRLGAILRQFGLILWLSAESFFSSPDWRFWRGVQLQDGIDYAVACGTHVTCVRPVHCGNAGAVKSGKYRVRFALRGAADGCVVQRMDAWRGEWMRGAANGCMTQWTDAWRSGRMRGAANGCVTQGMDAWCGGRLRDAVVSGDVAGQSAKKAKKCSGDVSHLLFVACHVAFVLTDFSVLRAFCWCVQCVVFSAYASRCMILLLLVRLSRKKANRKHAGKPTEQCSNLRR